MFAALAVKRSFRAAKDIVVLEVDCVVAHAHPTERRMTILMSNKRKTFTWWTVSFRSTLSKKNDYYVLKKEALIRELTCQYATSRA